MAHNAIIKVGIDRFYTALLQVLSRHWSWLVTSIQIRINVLSKASSTSVSVCFSFPSLRSFSVMMSEGTSSLTVSPSSSDLASHRSHGKMVVSEPCHQTQVSLKDTAPRQKWPTPFTPQPDLLTMVNGLQQPFLSWAFVWSPLCRDATLGWNPCCHVRSWFSL